MAFLNFGITPRGKISQKLRLFCPEFRENPKHASFIPSGFVQKFAGSVNSTTILTTRSPQKFVEIVSD